MPYIDKYLELAVRERASDLHFSADEGVRMRVDGDLVSIAEEMMPNEQLENMLLEICSEVEKTKFHEHKNLDKSYMAPNIGNFRVNIFKTRRGIAAVLRTIPTKIPTVEDLGLPDVIISLCELPKGLVLVTGPTGSGKSTTLAAMLNYINTRYPYHILTAEDPVEFVHTSKQSLVNQREIGSSCLTFADALKYALREDPDVILVGEMRDLETMSLAMTAAETGHLVFGTLHTRGAGPSVDRIIDSFPANQQAMVRAMLSDSLAGVVSQALLKRADGKGRVAAYEIMVVNHAVSNLVREGKTFQIPSIIQTARKEGMILLEQHIKELVAKGTVTAEEAAPYLEESGSAVKKPGGNAPTPEMKPKTISIKPGGSTPPGLGKPATPPAMKPMAPATPPSAPKASPPAPPVAQPVPSTPRPAAPMPAFAAPKPAAVPAHAPASRPAPAPAAAVEIEEEPPLELEDGLSIVGEGEEELTATVQAPTPLAPSRVLPVPPTPISGGAPKARSNAPPPPPPFKKKVG